MTFLYLQSRDTDMQILYFLSFIYISIGHKCSQTEKTREQTRKKIFYLFNPFRLFLGRIPNRRKKPSGHDFWHVWLFFVWASFSMTC